MLVMPPSQRKVREMRRTLRYGSRPRGGVIARAAFGLPRMTSNETPQQTSNEAAPPVEAPPAAPAEAAAPPATHEPAHADTATHADAPHAEAASEGAHGDAEHAHEGDAQEGATEGEGAHRPVVREMAEGAAPTPAAKRRRRRRKKGHGAHAEGGAPAAEGEAPAEGATAEDGEKHDAKDAKADRKKPRPPRPERERPAFNVGDVTFGKITEITDDVLFIDLLGKGRAIFDLRELLLPIDDEPAPEEPADEDEKHDEKHEEHADAAEAARVEDAPTATEAPDELAAPAAPEVVAEAATEAAETPAEAAPAEAAASEPAEATAVPEKPKHVDPPLPQVILEVGAQFVGVVHNDGGRGGFFVLTHHPKRLSKAKIAVSAALKDHALVHGIVTGVIKGGVEVDVDGLRAFAPGSHMDLRLGADLSHLIGKRLEFHVTQYGKRGRDVVLSRKPLLEAEAKKAREEALKTLSVGAVVEGVVRSVVPFGAFLDVGGIEGLVELKEMSHNRSDGPSDVFKPGEKYEVKILKIDDRGKVWLSRKACVPDPWGEVAKKYAVGTKHSGKVVRIQPFGAFVELEAGVDGLIHASDLIIPTATGLVGLKRVESINEIVKVGDVFECVVSHLDAGAHKIGLHPALTGDLANEPHQRVQQYKPVKAVVVVAEAGGLLVRVMGVTGRNARGYITAAATGTARGTELRKPFPAGTQVDAKVMEIDPKRGEVKLSIKALNEETERNAFQQYRQQVKTAARFTFGDLLNKKK
jgi:small subunit ribosomal protein S1